MQVWQFQEPFCNESFRNPFEEPKKNLLKNLQEPIEPKLQKPFCNPSGKIEYNNIDLTAM